VDDDSGPIFGGVDLFFFGASALAAIRSASLDSFAPEFEADFPASLSLRVVCGACCAIPSFFFGFPPPLSCTARLLRETADGDGSGSRSFRGRFFLSLPPSAVAIPVSDRPPPPGPHVAAVVVVVVVVLPPSRTDEPTDGDVSSGPPSSR
jgi:hypothetical protein